MNQRSLALLRRARDGPEVVGQYTLSCTPPTHKRRHPEPFEAAGTGEGSLAKAGGTLTALLFHAERTALVPVPVHVGIFIVFGLVVRIALEPDVKTREGSCEAISVMLAE